MRRFLLAGLTGLVGGCLLEFTANAQTPSWGGAYAPNFYNRQNQPLSPYLNLTRGGNPAVNYFYGVRPGVMGGMPGQQYGYGQQGMMRMTFFPQIDTLYELDNTTPQAGLRPTGHPYGFSNSLGYFGAGQGAGNLSRGQQFRGQQGGSSQGPSQRSRFGGR